MDEGSVGSNMSMCLTSLKSMLQMANVAIGIRCKMYPTSSRDSTLRPQLVAPFGKAVEPVRG